MNGDDDPIRLGRSRTSGLETADDVPDAAPPHWLGREVTVGDGYSNSSLAMSGLPVEQP